jgi:hypothetical protein
MAEPRDGEQMRIGEVLKSARTRQGMEIATAEERTKIRTKYLRAMEAEDWEVLPSPAYAKGFLRTYSTLLGLDADTIVDEFRRQVEGTLEGGHPLRLSEPLEGRRRGPGRGPSGLGPIALILVGVAAVVGVLFLIGVIGDDDEGGKGKPAREHAQKKAHGKKAGRQKKAPEAELAPQPQAVTLRLEVSSTLPVCLIGGGGDVLVAQPLSAGSEEQFTRSSFDLRFPDGYDRSQFKLFLEGKETRVPETTGPTAYTIKPGSKPQPADAPGATCP